MKKWRIFKGKHYSLSNLLTRLIPKLGSNDVTVNFTFAESCWFDYKDKDDEDVNKLFGYSFGNHHKNSVRIGWVPVFDKKHKIKLFFYVYNNGKRDIVGLTEVLCNVDYDIKISHNATLVTFELYCKGGQIIKKSIPFIVPKFKIGYWLWFYFGGNKPAPQTMTVFLRSSDFAFKD